MRLKTYLLMLIPFVMMLACGGENVEQTEGEQTMNEQAESDMTSGDRPLANVASAERADYYNEPPEMIIDENKKYTATIKTNKGDIVVELDALYAPLHTNNFVFLAKQGFYDGLTFHRHVPGFVIQGGDPLGTGTGGPGYRVPAEIGLLHDEGVIAMARQGDQVNPERKSSGSQFYITLAPTHNLDGQYSVFGRVVQGFDDVVMRLTQGDQIVRVDIEEE